MEQDLICFIILSNDEAAYNNCIHCLDQLIVPMGMRVQYMRGNGYDGNDTSLACQTAMEGSNAKYKIYITDRVSITNPRFLPTVIDAFRSDETLGILGVMGYSVPPFSDDFWTSAPIGAVTFCKNGKEKNAHYIYDEKNITPAKVLIPPILATQHDVPWRQMFQGARYAAMSLSLEHQRKGYKAAVLPQEAIWCSAEEIPSASHATEDEWNYRAEYAPEISGEFFVESEGRRYHPQIDPKFDEIRTVLQRTIHMGQYNDAIAILYRLNRYFITYNQFFRDESIESAYKLLCSRLNALYPKDVEPFTPEENCILFYDGICFDVRGLAAIYLKALAELGYKIIYVSTINAKGTVPTLMQILDSAPVKAEIVYLNENSYLSYSRAICQTVCKYRPARSIMYVDEVDPHARLAFLRLKGLLTRYYLIMGDHDYWSCPDSFDYSFEFRNWGASISHLYRRIPKEKMMMHPYYPFFDRNVTFQGYPFKRAEGDFIVFSGGALYKTFDDTMTYYQVIAWMLHTFPHVKFWYAGSGNDAPLRWLQEQFPGRVFYTAERKDLFQILEHIDMYLNTYPAPGGLMTQYSVCAKRPPLTLTTAPARGLNGVLLHDAESSITFASIDEWKTAIQKYITDENYRAELVYKIQNAVITPEQFRNNLKRIFEEGKSDFEISVSPVDLTESYNWYFTSFVRLWEAGAYDTK